MGKEPSKRCAHSLLRKDGEVSLHSATTLSHDQKAAFVDASRLVLSGSMAGRLAGPLLDWGRAAALDGELDTRLITALTPEEWRTRSELKARR